MKKILTLGILLISGFSYAEGEGPVCHRCEKIREYNAEHPENNYYWYDDYLKDQKDGVKKPTPNAVEKENQTTEAPAKKK